MRALRLWQSPMFALAWVALATSLALQTGNLGSVDTRRRLQVAHSFWTDAPQVRPEDAVENGIPGRNGTPKAPFGLGQALVMLPADVLATKALGEGRIATVEGDRLRCALVALLTFPVITTLAVVLGFRLLLALGFDEREGLAGALGLQLASSFFQYTQVHQENSLCLALAFGAALGVLRWARTGDRRALALATVALGFDLLVRITTLVDATVVLGLGVGLILRDAPNRRPGWRQIIGGAAIVLPILGVFVGVDRAYHYARFGSLTTTYSHLMGAHLRSKDPSLPAGFPFGGPFWPGFVGPFVSLNKSVFIFDPLLLLPVGLAVSRRLDPRSDATAWLLGGAALLVADAAIYATYVPWGGSACWGDRYVLGGVHAIVLVAVPLVLRARPHIGRIARASFLAVVCASVAIQILSVLLSYNVESEQRASFVVGQRLVNVVALAGGKFDAWGLSRPGFLESEEARRITLLPIIVKQRMPGAATAALGGWLVLVGLVGAGLARCHRLATAHDDDG